MISNDAKRFQSFFLTYSMWSFQDSCSSTNTPKNFAEVTGLISMLLMNSLASSFERLLFLFLKNTKLDFLTFRKFVHSKPFSSKWQGIIGFSYQGTKVCL